MLSVLANRTYRHLFAAQVIALIGTGLLTVALGLLAYRLAGAEAGAVLGTALAIKMVAYVLVAPIANAFTGQLPRRAFLVATDLVRAGVALILPFVDQVWQVYLLVFVLQACSAAFTPTFQATIPDILPEERDYTRALSLSRLAYDLENLLSPTLAALLLTVIDFHWLFGGTVVGFLCSAALVVSVALPSPTPPERRALERRERDEASYAFIAAELDIKREKVADLLVGARLKVTEAVTPTECDYACASDNFTTGNAAMIINGDWELGNYSDLLGDDLGVAPIPAIAETGELPKPYVGGSFYMVPSGVEGDTLTVVLDFIDFTLAADQQRALVSELSRLPANGEVLADPSVTDDPLLQGAAEAVAAGVPQPINVEMRCNFDAMTAAVRDVLGNGNNDFDAVAQTMQEAAENCIATLG